MTLSLLSQAAPSARMGPLSAVCRWFPCPLSTSLSEAPSSPPVSQQSSPILLPEPPSSPTGRICPQLKPNTAHPEGAPGRHPLPASCHLRCEAGASALIPPSPSHTAGLALGLSQRPLPCGTCRFFQSGRRSPGAASGTSPTCRLHPHQASPETTKVAFSESPRDHRAPALLASYSGSRPLHAENIHIRWSRSHKAHRSLKLQCPPAWIRIPSRPYLFVF